HFRQIDDFVDPTAGRMPRFMERMIDSGLDSLLDTVIDGCTKGFPQRAPSVRLGDMGRRGWNLPAGDLDTPVAVPRPRLRAQTSPGCRSFCGAPERASAPTARPLWPRSSFIGSWPRAPGASLSRHHSRLAWPNSSA